MNFMVFIMLMATLTAYLNFLTRTKYMLMSLLSLEMITLSMVLLITSISSENSMTTPMLSIVILTLSVCEASLGLTLLVMMSRTSGNDMFKSNFNQTC